MRVLLWLFRAAIFFVLFAFALNNQHEATLKWFFGYEWRTPLVFIVLGAFIAGCACGMLAMLPSWWRHRRAARRPAPASTGSAAPPSTTDAAVLADDLSLPHPPRDGL
jgi:putative membrane protein